MHNNINKIQVISLKRSLDRRKVFAVNNPGLEFDFFDAVDGRALSDEVTGNRALFGEKLHYTPENYGITLSHLALWETAIQANRVITVAEDDAVFRLDFTEQANISLQSLPDEWDIVLWGWNFDSILSLNTMFDISPAILIFNEEMLRQSIDTFRHQKDTPAILRLEKCFGLPAYSVSPEGARKLRSRCFPINPCKIYFPILDNWLPNTSIDIEINRHYRHVNAFCSLPPLAVTPNDKTTSTVQV